MIKATEPDVPSPCVRVCRLNDEGLCEGCWRTLEEISDWWLYSGPEKREVIDRTSERRTKADSV